MGIMNPSMECFGKLGFIETNKGPLGEPYLCHAYITQAHEYRDPMSAAHPL